MSRLSKTLKRHRFITVTIGVIVVGIFVGVVLAVPMRIRQGSNSPTQEPRITNKTSAIRIAAIDRQELGDSLVLSLRLQNVSTKPIKAYAIANGKRWVTRNYFLSDESIAPNAITQHIIPLNHFSREHGLSIAAVLFEDGTSDGDSLFVFRLSETYAGMRDQANKLLPCLRRLSSTLGPQHEAVASDCESEAGRLPTKGRSSDYDEGLRNVQQEFLTQLRDFKEKLHNSNFAEATLARDKSIRIAHKLAQQ